MIGQGRIIGLYSTFLLNGELANWFYDDWLEALQDFSRGQIDKLTVVTLSGGEIEING